MPGFLIQIGAALQGPHGAPITIAPGNLRVRLSGQPAATVSDLCTVAGCPFVLPGPKPQPCVRVQWLIAATRVRIGGQPALLQDSKGLCLSAEQIPAGPPIVVSAQPRVRGM
jgi:hypothetical protein